MSLPIGLLSRLQSFLKVKMILTLRELIWVMKTCQNVFLTTLVDRLRASQTGSQGFVFMIIISIPGYEQL